MNFKQWLLSEEQLFNEDFKTKEKKFIQQGIEPNTVKSYLDKFRTIKNYREIKDQIHGLEHIHIKDRNNVDAYQRFEELKTLVDYVTKRRDVSGKTSYKNIEVDADPIYEDNDLIIYYADSPQACIAYKGNVPYSWCIARSDASNMFYTYRFKEYEPAFYFVKNKERTNNEFELLNRNTTPLRFTDKYHFFVIQVVKNANPQNKDQKQYIVTSAQNLPGDDKQMSWNDIVQIEPKLADKQNYFVSKPLQPEEKALHKRFINGITDEEFEKLLYAEKDMYLNIYVRMDRNLTDNQFKNLPDDLKNKYIGVGVGLSDEQVEMIDVKLYKRYEKVIKTKIEKTIGTRDFQLKPSEINILIKFAHEFDFNKLSDDNVEWLIEQVLGSANANNKDKIAEFLGKYNLLNKLTDENVRSLLYYSENKYEMAKLLGKALNKLSDNNVRWLLHYSENKDEMAKLLGKDNLNKLSDDNVEWLLYYAKDRYKMAQILNQYIQNKTPRMQELINKYLQTMGS